MSLSVSPDNVSASAPPYNSSLPEPPLNMSPPALPDNVSLPAAPSIISFELKPYKASLLSELVNNSCLILFVSQTVPSENLKESIIVTVSILEFLLTVITAPSTKVISISLLPQFFILLLPGKIPEPNSIRSTPPVS